MSVHLPIKYRYQNSIFKVLFPQVPRDFAFRRWILIFLRSLHVFTAGTLLGGHVFGASVEVLYPWLAATIATGLIILAVNAHATMTVFFELRGIAILVKMTLLLLVSVFNDAAVPLLAATLFIGVIGSHIPKRYRHKVFLIGEHVVIDDRNS